MKLRLFALIAIDQGALPRTMTLINQTQIEGRFDFTLDWMPDETQFGGAKVPDNGKPNIYEAFREQLGLRLEATRAPADIMVVDRVEKPSEN